MDMDDSDDKIRRNLVAASVIVLGLAFAGIPLATLVDRIANPPGSSTPLHVQAWRIDVMVLAVVAYFFVRFRFSGDAIASRAQRDGSRRAMGIEATRRIVLLRLRLFSWLGYESSAFGGQLRATMQARIAEHVTNVRQATGADPPGKFSRPRAELDGFEVTEADSRGRPTRGRVSVGCRFSKQSAAPNLDGQVRIPFALSGLALFEHWLRTDARLALWSPTAMELTVPTTLGASAIGVAAIRLAIDLWPGLGRLIP